MIVSCNTSTDRSQNIDIQGHRGCRGNYPENTLIAFEKAITEFNVHTLEMDLVISKDSQVVVSHEPYFSHEITTLEGNRIPEGEELTHNLFSLNYDEIKKYDVGSIGNAKFPSQVKVAAVKPTLSLVIAQSEKLNPTIAYNLEIKRKREYDGVYHPDYKFFADAVVKEIRNRKIDKRSTIQSFDIETLRYLHNTYPDIKLVYLVEHSKNIVRNFNALGFYPYAYSPYYKLLSKPDIRYCHKNNIKVIPWTINNPQDIKRYIEMGIDGIITDYPGRVQEYLATIQPYANH